MADDLPDVPDSVATDQNAEDEARAVSGKERLDASVTEDKTKKQIALTFLAEAIYFCVRVLVYVVAALFMIGLIVWFWHLLAPHCLRWLERDDLENLKTILFGSAVSALAINISKKASE